MGEKKISKSENQSGEVQHLINISLKQNRKNKWEEIGKEVIQEKFLVESFQIESVGQKVWVPAVCYSKVSKWAK